MSSFSPDPHISACDGRLQQCQAPSAHLLRSKVEMKTLMQLDESTASRQNYFYQVFARRFLKAEVEQAPFGAPNRQGTDKLDNSVSLCVQSL